MKFNVFPTLLLLASLCFAGCGQDDELTMSYEDYDTDEDINAPIVDCTEAFSVYDYRTASAPFEPRLLQLEVGPNGEGLAVGGDLQLFRVSENGENWDTLPGVADPLYFYLIDRVTDEVFYLVSTLRSGNSGNNRLFRTDDRGLTFSEVSRFPRDLSYIRGLYFENATDGYAIANVAESFDTRLLSTRDGGQSWTEVPLSTPLSGAEFVQVEGRIAILDRNNLYLLNPDGTLAPRSLPDVEFIEQSTFDGNDRGWLLSDRTLYGTSDAGRSWELLSELPINFVNQLIMNADGSGIALGSRYRVIGGDALSFTGRLTAETTDGGLTWTARKTDGDCGYDRRFFRVADDRLLGVGTELVILDR